MSDVTHLLDAAAAGDRQAAADLLPLVYDELRKLAAARMAVESPEHTLQPTALVHEAYLRLVGPADAARWDNRGHFFAAAAEAMRRILVEAARRKRRAKHGGERQRVALDADSNRRPGRPPRPRRPRRRPHPAGGRGFRKRLSLSNSATSPGFPSRRPRWPWESRRAPPTASGRSPGRGCTENWPIQKRRNLDPRRIAFHLSGQVENLTYAEKNVA